MIYHTFIILLPVHIGSFICIREQSCGTGYTYNQDKRTCEDINECKLNLHYCKEPFKCVNYDGTFRLVKEMNVFSR
jgi:hypothetical protein